MKLVLAVMMILLVLVAGCGQTVPQQNGDAPLGIEKVMAQNELQQKNITSANITLKSRMVQK
jgi:Na+-transporting methylmalonyl-CoA/oxaloacetate decarboxylase gamma subunit